MRIDLTRLRAVFRRMLETFGFFSLIAVIIIAALFYSNAFRLSIPLRGWVHEIAHGISPARLKPDLKKMTDDNISVAWIGHGTCLINFYGVWILTDPVFSNRVGLRTPWGGVFGSRRMVAPALAIDELPKLDVALITHAHMDHLDPSSLKALPKDATLVTPTGFSDFASEAGFQKTVEMGWNKEASVAGLSLYAFAPKHWGNRTPWEKQDRGFNSYLISRNGKTILLAGDTGYTSVFENIAREHRIDIAIFDLGAYLPKWFRKNHATSEEIWKMFKQTKAEVLLPIHWGTFIHSQEGINDPILWLRAAAGDEFDEKVKIKFIGEVWQGG